MNPQIHDLYKAATDARNRAYSPYSKLKVGGPVTDSVFAAGVVPTNDVFGDADDVLAGGNASGILSVSAAGPVDDATRFVAGLFGKVRIGREKGVNPAEDPRFVRLA